MQLTAWQARSVSGRRLTTRQARMIRDELASNSPAGHLDEHDGRATRLVSQIMGEVASSSLGGGDEG